MLFVTGKETVERWRYVFLLFPQTQTALSEELGDIADKTKVNSMASAGGYHSAEFSMFDGQRTDRRGLGYC